MLKANIEMHIFTKINFITWSFLIVMLIFVAGFGFSTRVGAQDTEEECNSQSASVAEAERCIEQLNAGQPQLPQSEELVDGQDNCDAEVLTRDNCSIINYLVILINFLSALAGIVIVGSIMVAGYQYMTAQDNAGQVQAARKRIILTLAALALFVFMYALLNFLVPGGVL